MCCIQKTELWIVELIKGIKVKFVTDSLAVVLFVTADFQISVSLYADDKYLQGFEG